ncbi:MAG: EboA domain-containing protein [Nannocystaceae bacterium]
MGPNLAATLQHWIASQDSPASAAWFASACAIARQPHSTPAFLTHFAAAGRRLGTQHLEFSSDIGDIAPKVPPPPTRSAIAPEFQSRRWPIAEAGRVTLLVLHAKSIAPDRHWELVSDMYYRGTLEERQAVSRTLPYLPEPARFLIVAVDAVRSNASAEFSAIAAHNPYPGAHFDDAAFSQMTLKALTMGVPLADIMQLPERRTTELDRMLKSYASERSSAGRPIPDDIQWLARQRRR